MNVKNFIRSLRETGAAGIVGDDRKRIMLVNTLSLATGTFAFILGTFLAILLKEKWILYPALAEGMLFYLVIFINSNRKYVLAAATMLAVQNISAIYFGIIFGAVSAIQLLVLCLVSASLILFRQKSMRVVCITMAVVCLVFLELNNQFNFLAPLPSVLRYQILIRWMAIPVILFINILVILFYVRLNDEHTKVLEAANFYKTLFVQETSHEIRSPLNAVFGISQLLLLNLEKDKDKKTIDKDTIRPLAEHLYMASYNIRSIINNILEFSKFQAGKIDSLKNDRFLLREWLKDAVNLHAYNAKIKGVAIKLQVAEDLPVDIIADLVKLTQILNNLLSNAIKFTNENSKIYVNVCREDANLVVKVIDEGLGIKPEMQSSIFDAFVSENVKHFESSGLGLSIGKRLAEICGGSLTLLSSSDKGSVFALTFPLKTGTEGVLIDFSKSLHLRSGHFKDLKILIMEDNLMSQVIITKYLKELECHVVVANDGMEGLEKAQEDKPDIIFLDTHMPVMSGMDTLKAIRESNTLKDIPVIAISGDAFKESIEEAINAGANEYITKPVEFKQLHFVLDKYFKHS